MWQSTAGQPWAARRTVASASHRFRTVQSKPYISGQPQRRCQHTPVVCSAAPTQQQQQQQQPAQPQQWRGLTGIKWAGSEQDALQADSPMAAQLPLWRLLLLSDGKNLSHFVGRQRDARLSGSVTRHLQLLTGSAVKVDCLAMAPVPADGGGLPPVVHDMLAAPLLQREVLLRNPGDGARALVHATSWWNAAAASSNLQDPSQPIWVSLTQAHKELYREIQMVQLGSSAELEQHFGACGPFWGRLYLFWHGGQPLTVIHEVFSPHLVEYLQPSNGGSLV